MELFPTPLVALNEPAIFPDQLVVLSEALA